MFLYRAACRPHTVNVVPLLREARGLLGILALGKTYGGWKTRRV